MLGHIAQVMRLSQLLINIIIIEYLLAHAEYLSYEYVISLVIIVIGFVLGFLTFCF
mgnify:CR=1 FL=1|jgi:hypothetical protein